MERQSPAHDLAPRRLANESDPVREHAVARGDQRLRTEAVAGLVGDNYAARVEQYLEQEGLADANRKTRFNTSEVTQREARLAFDSKQSK